jgi:hypothetical protein
MAATMATDTIEPVTRTSADRPVPRANESAARPKEYATTSPTPIATEYTTTWPSSDQSMNGVGVDEVVATKGP